MAPGMPFSPGTSNSVTTPAVVMRPSLSVFDSLNHRLPSGPTAMSPAKALVESSGYSVTSPSAVMRPISSSRPSVNHSAPSGPSTIEVGNESGSSA